MNPATKYGYIKDKILPEHYVFGSGQVQGVILQPDGQWDAFLPPDEFQNLYGVEPYACATFGTFNALEIMSLRLFGERVNFSDRFTAKVSGTQYQRGNSPHTVAEFIRKIGAVPEFEWPITPDVDTFDKWYAEPPKRLYDVARIRFLDVYEFGHDWITSPTPDKIKDALRYGPVGVSVYAWAAGHDGRFYKPSGVEDNHWCVIYGYEDGVAWHVFDSYDNTHKRLVWDFAFEVGKRYVLAKKVPTADADLFTRIWRAILYVLNTGSLTLVQKEAVVAEIARDLMSRNQPSV